MSDIGANHERQLVAREIAENICNCNKCSSELVQPVDWLESGKSHWQVSLRCPNCWQESTVIVHDEIVDEYDLLLERGAALLARSLQESIEEQIGDEARILRDALESGLLLPEDF